MFSFFRRVLGVNTVASVDNLTPSEKPKTPREILDAQLKARTESSRTQAGAGARGGTTIPEIVAKPGQPVVNQLARQGKMPPMDTTKLGPPL